MLSHSFNARRLTLLLMFIVAHSHAAYAIDKIYSPNVTQGELEIEYSGSATFDSDRAKNNSQEHEMELEYGITNRVVVELSGSFEKEPGEKLKFDGVGFGGRYQFFEQGENWLDSGLLLSYSRAAHRDTDPDDIEAKLLLEKQYGHFVHRANIGIEQEIGPHSSGGPDRVFLWNSRYRLSQYFEPGIELQSDFGKTNENKRFRDQEHYIGPAAIGQIMPGVKYEAAYYVGASDAASKGAARALLEYELYF